MSFLRSECSFSGPTASSCLLCTAALRALVLPCNPELLLCVQKKKLKKKGEEGYPFPVRPPLLEGGWGTHPDFSWPTAKLSDSEKYMAQILFESIWHTYGGFVIY